MRAALDDLSLLYKMSLRFKLNVEGNAKKVSSNACALRESKIPIEEKQVMEGLEVR